MSDKQKNINWVTERSGYVPGRINAGILRGEGDACIVVDTGLDKSAGNRIAAALAAEGLKPTALLVTHTHADHCGGNAALAAACGMPVYGPEVEAAILAHPALEPLYLFGAAAPDALLEKFFLAPPSPGAQPLTAGTHVIGGVRFTAVELAGHSPGHFGYLSEDGVLYCGDAIFPDYVWEKYRLPYFFDIDAALAALDRIERMAPALTDCIAAHYGPVSAAELAAVNREGLHRLADWTRAAIASPASREDVVAAAFAEHGLQESAAQFFLVNSTVGALLIHLVRAGQAESTMEKGRLLYRAK